jgi:hypothetical protein
LFINRLNLWQILSLLLLSAALPFVAVAAAAAGCPLHLDCKFRLLLLLQQQPRST